MCGRFTLTRPNELITDLFGLIPTPVLPPRFNIAPGQYIPVVREIHGGPFGGDREVALLRWGLIPPWAKNQKLAYKLVNARSETAAENPAFRNAFRRRRCLVPADGYYEWREEAGRKQPYWIHFADHHPFALAGLWEHWESPEDDRILETCTILTTEANEVSARIHERMPVICPAGLFADWLGPDERPPALEHILRPYPAEGMVAVPASPKVNNPGNEGPECLRPEREVP